MHGANKNKPLRWPRAARAMHAACTGHPLTAANRLGWLICACCEALLRMTATTCAHAVTARGDGARRPQPVRMERVAARPNAREQEERDPDLGGAFFQGFLPPKTAKGLWSPFTEWYAGSAFRTKQASERRICLCRGCYRAREGQADTILDREPENLGVLCSSWCQQRSARAGGRYAPSMQAQALTPVVAELPGADHGALHVP